MEVINGGGTTLWDIIAAVSAAICAIGVSAPFVRRWAIAVWRDVRKTLPNDYASAKSAPLWLKAALAMMLVWSVGSLLAFGLTGGMAGTAPVLVMFWVGSVAVAVSVAYPVWLGHAIVRWVKRPPRVTVGKSGSQSP